jgi:hypothetical protein
MTNVSATLGLSQQRGGLTAMPAPISPTMPVDLWAVLHLSKRIKSAGGSFALCGVRNSVREVLDISDFTSMFSIHRARAEAMAAMGK